jgi:AraC-like DNA-binding protein
MLQHALPLIVLQYRRDRLLANRARMLMTARPSEQHIAPGLANALNVSVRTLHRQLEEEGTSLQALRDAVRRAPGHRTVVPYQSTDKADCAVGWVRERKDVRPCVPAMDR